MNKGGYGKRIAELNNMEYHTRASSGATIVVEDDSENNIVKQVDEAIASGVVPDYVIFNGYTNDITSQRTTPIGTLSDGYEAPFDTSTFTGAFEYICHKLQTTWNGVRILYIRPHKMPSRVLSKQIEYGNRALEVCKKWSIPVINMFDEGIMNTYISTHDGYYTNTGDPTHPNANGYKYGYTPIIESKLKEL